MQPQVQQIMKSTGDVTAYGAVVGTLMGWLPAIAAGFTIIWLGMQMLEKITGKAFHELVACVWKKIRG
jgi:carbon monoxide dehydrogenase subunit G